MYCHIGKQYNERQLLATMKSNFKFQRDLTCPKRGIETTKIYNKFELEISKCSINKS